MLLLRLEPAIGAAVADSLCAVHNEESKKAIDLGTYTPT